MPFDICLAVFLCLSLTNFIIYAVDKKRAKNGEWRIPEKVLLILSFLGGAYGGYTAMFLIRHKTKKGYFHFVNLLGMVWQTALLIFLYRGGI